MAEPEAAGTLTVPSVFKVGARCSAAVVVAAVEAQTVHLHCKPQPLAEFQALCLVPAGPLELTGLLQLAVDPVRMAVHLFVVRVAVAVVEQSRPTQMVPRAVRVARREAAVAVVAAEPTLALVVLVVLAVAVRFASTLGNLFYYRLEPPRIFESAAIKAAVALAEKVALVDIPVLLSGETGTGKEVIASIIHKGSERRSSEMVTINCAGLPADLIEGELFGSRRGAFTGSVDEKSGLVRQADGGTLFLDELSDMPFNLQSKLLRFVQDRRFRKLGSITNEYVNTRIIAAVNKPPLVCVAEKCLREDLYYRLSAITIVVPPLRDRREDILPLARNYLRYFCSKFKRTPPLFDGAAGQALLTYSWPGNVRQLINTMTRCALLCGDTIYPNDLNLPETAVDTSDGWKRWLTRDLKTMKVKEVHAAKSVIEAFLSGGTREKAAEILGISRGSLYEKVKRFGISLPIAHAPPLKRTPPRNGHATPSAGRLPSRVPVLPAPRSAEPVVEPPASRSVVQPEEGFLD